MARSGRPPLWPREPGTVVDALTDFPETSVVLSAAQAILDFKTQTARDVTVGRIKSIIDPPLGRPVAARP